VVAAHFESRLQAVLADDLREIIRELIGVLDPGLRAVTAEAEGKETGHANQRRIRSG
jgi:hypothetical protein